MRLGSVLRGFLWICGAWEASLGSFGVLGDLLGLTWGAQGSLLGVTGGILGALGGLWGIPWWSFGTLLVAGAMKIM